MALHRGPWPLNAVSLPLTSCDASVGGLLATPTPSPSRTTSTVLVHSVSTGRKVPRPSSISCTPPPTVCTLPGTGGRPFQTSFQRFYSDLTYQTSQPGCRTPPVSILGLTTRSCRHLRRRRHFDVLLPARAYPARPRPLSSPRTSARPPHPPPH